MQSQLSLYPNKIAAPGGAPAEFPRLELPADFSPRRLLLILGDQLTPQYLEHTGFDPTRDAVVMFEVAEESTHVPSHKARTTLFLAAMRHFALGLRESGTPILYVTLDDPENSGSFAGELKRLAQGLRAQGASDPEGLAVIRPGEWRVLQALESVAGELGWPLELHEDPHFLTDPERFAKWAEGRKQLVLEYFYRDVRKRQKILLDENGKPEGGQWNFDKDNRKPLGKNSPDIPETPRYEPGPLTLEVMALVEKTFPEAPGELQSFSWPVTREQALHTLEDFVENRLPYFGDYQDALKIGEPWLFHSLLSPAMNLKLIDPREVLDAVLEAYRQGRAPINAVEGFVRQIVGWREFIRGVYWHEGPDYGDRNGLEESGELPEMYWSAQTKMTCMSDSLGQVKEHGYGHHIQRLMVTGNFALVAGIHPRAISDWYLGMYVDAVDWVTLPNTLGMVMHADGGVVGTKPYAASGRYVSRMSNYCKNCSFDPGKRTGDKACPMTTLYWDFLRRHRERLGDNRRMAFAWKNLDRIEPDELAEIQQRAEVLRTRPEELLATG